MNWLPEHAPTLSFAKMAPAQIVAINAVTQVAGLPISPPTWEPKSTGGRFGGISGYNTPQNPCLERISGNCSVAPGTNTQNPNPHRLGFFLPAPPVLVRFPGLASRAPPLRRRRFCPHQRLSVLRFLWWARERSRGHFLCWRGFRGGRLWLATPVAVATEFRAAAKKPPAGGCWRWVRRANPGGASTHITTCPPDTTAHPDAVCGRRKTTGRQSTPRSLQRPISEERP